MTAPAPRMVVSAALHLDGAAAPRVWTVWHDDNATVSVLFDAGPNQRIGFVGTPQEIRLALASGLAAIDRAVAERAAEQHDESFACAVFHGPLGEPLSKEVTDAHP